MGVLVFRVVQCLLEKRPETPSELWNNKRIRKILTQKGVADSDLYYFKDKGSIKITSKLEALGRTLLSGAIG